MIELIPCHNSSSWMLLNFGHLLENILYGMQQSQHSQFWMADLNPQILSNATEWVYTAFFCSNSVQQLRTISEVLFGHFVTTLNDAFERELTIEDKGYESGSEGLNIPTPLHTTPHLYHVLAGENLSFGPATHSSLSSICCCLTFSNDESFSTDDRQLHGRSEHSSPVEQQIIPHLIDDSFQDIPSEEEEEVEEHFPTALLDNDVWMEEPVPDGHLSIHEQSQAHDLCPYPLAIQLGSGTPCSRICTSTTVHGPQQHL